MEPKEVGHEDVE